MRTLFLPLLLLSAVAQAATPQLEPWEKVLQSQLDLSDREQILQLATFLPKLFGLRFVCQFTSTDKSQKPAPVIPGEWVTAPAGGDLHCPDHLDVTVEKGAKLRVRQTMNGLPLFFLESGDVHLHFGRDSLFVETPAFAMALAGVGKTQQLTLSVDPQKSTFDCTQGALAATFEGKEDATGSRKLLSRQCRIEVTLPPNPQPHYILGNDSVDAENLTLSRRFWPSAESPANQKTPTSPSGFQHLRLFAFNNKITWELGNNINDAECTLFGQKSEDAPLMEISKFTAKPQGEMPLDPAYSSGIVSLLCESEKGTLASNAMAVTVTK